MIKTKITFQILIFAIFTMLLFFLLKKPVARPKIHNRVINVYVWGDFFNVASIRKFEKKHNATINLNYYLSNEELLAKIRNSNGNTADIIFPSDYTIKTLIDENYLEKLDQSKINFMHKIDPFILNKPFDPGNRYSLPYAWEVYGIIANKNDPIASKVTTIHEILQNQNLKNITMPSDPIETFCLTMQALYSNLKATKANEISSVIDILKEQRNRVLAYTDYQAKFIFASKSSNIGITRSSYFNLLAEEAENHELQFTIPDDGPFITIETCALLKSNKDKTLIYEFINDIYDEDNMLKHIQECPAFPALGSLIYDLDFPSEYFEIYKNAKKYKNLCFFTHPVSEQTIRKEWIKIKAT